MNSQRVLHTYTHLCCSTNMWINGNRLSWLWNVFSRCSVRIWARILTILTEVLRDFPQFLQWKSRALFQIRRRLWSSTLFCIPSSLSSINWRCIIWSVGRLNQWFSTGAIWPPRWPCRISEGPQVKVVKLGAMETVKWATKISPLKSIYY
jgi:hypothetical protein